MQKTISILIKGFSSLWLLGSFGLFLILCFYCFPAVDDFSFANITDTYGYFEAQYHWYTTWTGRYFSTAVLSLVPVMLRNFFLYHLVSLFIFLATGHSLYYLVRSLMPGMNRARAILMATAGVLSYLLFLPDINEAFYWFPGSATYQVPAFLGTYLLGLVVRHQKKPMEGHPRRRVVAMCILAFMIVGSNEVAMASTVVAVSSYYIFSVFRHKRIFNDSLPVLVTTAVGSALLVFAPGNTVRAEGELSERDVDHVWEALSMALSETLHVVGHWLWLPGAVLIILIALGFRSHVDKRLRWGVLVAVVLLQLVMVFAVVFPTFYLTKSPPPLRTLNTAHWILVLGAVYIGWFLSPVASKITARAKLDPFYLGVLGFLIVLYAINGYNGLDKAYADVVSGSAAEHKRQYLERGELLDSCSAEVCIVPAYTVFPHTTFHSDLDEDSGEWWNYMYGIYHGAKRVSIDYGSLDAILSNTLTFHPSETFMENYRLENLSDSMVYEGGHSYHLTPDVLYGGGITFEVDSISRRFGSQLAYLEAGAYALFSDTLRDVHIVTVVTRPGKERPLKWASVTWENPLEKKEDWWYTEIRVPLYKLNLQRNDRVQIFLWNPNGRDVYVDELSYSVY